MPKERTDIDEFLKNPDLKDHTAYLVKVAYNVNNPIHKAILFVGFKKSGGYCEIFINNYELPERIHKAYFIEIVKELCSLE